jgi:hypothetical protein
LKHLGIPKIKCWLCPDTNFSEEFKRHCDTTVAHPLKVTFCNNCGDYFARTDALERHRRKVQVHRKWVTASPGKSKEKRSETQRAHEEFKERLRESLRTGRDIGMPFSQIIKEKYPDSLEEAHRGAAGVESAQRTLIKDIIFMLTI